MARPEGPRNSLFLPARDLLGEKTGRYGGVRTRRKEAGACLADAVLRLSRERDGRLLGIEAAGGTKKQPATSQNQEREKKSRGRLRSVPGRKLPAERDE